MNCEFKKDNFKKSIILHKEVRPVHSSVETFVMSVERRDWQGLNLTKGTLKTYNSLNHRAEGGKF